jgi:hypothetical protein
MRALRALESLAGMILFFCVELADFNVVWTQCMLISECIERNGAALV